MTQLTFKGSSESDFSLFICCEKSPFRIFFILRTVMVDTSLYSKMVRKVKLICVDLLSYWLENCPREKTFPLLESQNKPSLAETWLIWYKIKSRKRKVTQADEKLSTYGRNSTFLSRRYPSSAGFWRGSMCRDQLPDSFAFCPKQSQ